MITYRQKIRKKAKSFGHQLIIRQRSAVPVFIFGEMRSGTNMLTACLDRSWRTAVYNENDPDGFEKYELLDNDFLARLILRSRATHVIFKSLADSARAAELLNVFESAKALWIFRNYTDVVNSAIRKWQEHRKYLEYILENRELAAWRAMHLPPQSLEIIRNHFDRGIDDASSRALIWYIRNLLYFYQKLESNDRVCLVRYERLVSSPKAEFSRIFGFLDLPLHDNYLEKVTASSVRRDADPKLDEQVAALCESLLTRLVFQEGQGNLTENRHRAKHAPV